MSVVDRRNTYDRRYKKQIDENIQPYRCTNFVLTITYGLPLLPNYKCWMHNELMIVSHVGNDDGKYFLKAL